jgi:hypothetical protein
MRTSIPTASLGMGMVGLFLTGADEPEARYSFERYGDPFVSLREILFDGSGMLVFRDPRVAAPDHEAGEDSHLVEEFFTDSRRQLGLVT